jgi:hypothetical protein
VILEEIANSEFALSKKEKREGSPADPLDAFRAFPNFGLADMHTIPARNIASCMHYVSSLELHLAAYTPVSPFPARNIAALMHFVFPGLLIGGDSLYCCNNAFHIFSTLLLAGAHTIFLNFAELSLFILSCNQPPGKPRKAHCAALLGQCPLFKPLFLPNFLYYQMA